MILKSNHGFKLLRKTGCQYYRVIFSIYIYKVETGLFAD